MNKETFVDSLVDYFEKKTALSMSNITSEEDILLCDSLDAFYGKYYDYGYCVLGILYLREDGFDSIVVMMVDKDSENISCWNEIVRASNILDIEGSLISNGIENIDVVLEVIEEDYL